VGPLKSEKKNKLSDKNTCEAGIPWFMESLGISDVV
jgi:hypothetical protein